jgi:hypothetical protein
MRNTAVTTIAANTPTMANTASNSTSVKAAVSQRLRRRHDMNADMMERGIGRV